MSLRKLSPTELLAHIRGKSTAEPEDFSSPATAVAELEPVAESAAEPASESHETDADGEEPGEFVNSGRGGVVRKRRMEALDAVKGHRHLEALFERVNSLLGESSASTEEGFRPRVPQTLHDTGLTEEDIQKLALKFLMQKGSASGREISIQLKLPFGLIDPLLKNWKNEQLIALKSTAEMGDYIFTITEIGRERARRFTEECTYFGAAPVSLREYLKSMEAQTSVGLQVTEEALRRAFSDLLVRDELLDQLGPAINSGRGMFLFGEAGNGKTSLAERVTRCFGDTIWIPRALGIDGDIIRLFDPGVHEEVETPSTEGLFDLSGVDPRWVRIVRPTVVAGGELTMSELEVSQNPTTKICEAPLQLKSNGGTLVIDDFGRQTMPTTVLLNRWIVPLEKRYDFLNLPSGKKIQVPFDQLIIFSTNLEPKSLVDGAFLRRIPYKIKVPDPTPEHFRKLCEILAPKLGLIHDPSAVDYLLEKHYESVNRPLRSCQPRDLLLQVRNYCTYKQLPKRVTREGFDYAVANYFSVM
jgi:predicted ATPase with chaperone activity